MSETLPPRPALIPPPDRHQLERLNDLYNLSIADPPRNLGDRIASLFRKVFVRVLRRQQDFNTALVDHINRNVAVGVEAHHASALAADWMQSALDQMERHQQALAAWERRTNQAVASLSASHEELRVSLGVLQQAAQHLKHEVARMAAAGVPMGGVPSGTSAAPALDPSAALDSHKYVGFEDQFRGSSDDIRARVTEYLPVFRGARDVVDVGCGRGEFLALLKEEGIIARGIDLNSAMVEVCRQRGLDASEADALTYLQAQADGSLGGLFAAQVIEHLEPRYLAALLDTAFDKLRPGAPIVLETINPACWFAFFESYIRDVTHVRAIHPDTLKYMLIANGFQHVEIKYRAPYPEHDKLQPVAPVASLGDAVDTLNANVERINRLLFTYLDYAAIGRRP
jgi:2-polyprenyl-3-methyl-5-hydroxy-6-metoxy-1,4-benzoquinol methylase